jgi:hypothetical protein
MVKTKKKKEQKSVLMIINENNENERTSKIDRGKKKQVKKYTANKTKMKEIKHKGKKNILYL